MVTRGCGFAFSRSFLTLLYLKMEPIAMQRVRFNLIFMQVFQMSAEEVLVHPRFHDSWRPGERAIDRGFRDGVMVALRDLGPRVREAKVRGE